MSKQPGSKRIAFWAILVFSFLSCSPSLYQLKQFELAKTLKEETLYIPLRNEDDNIALLRKYGQTKKANRLQAEVMQENEARSKAVKSFYQFSDYKFISEHDINEELNYTLKFSIDEDDSDSRDRYVHTLTIYAPINIATNQMNGKVIEVQHSTTFSTKEYDYLVRAINDRLVSFYEKAE